MPAPKDPIAYALWKQRLSESHKGEKNVNYGKPVSEDRKQKQRDKMVGRMVGEKNPMYGVRFFGEKNHQFGKPLSESTKNKLSISHTGKKFSDCHRKKMSEAKVGMKNSFFGKKHNEDTIKILSLPKTREHRIHLSASMQGVPLSEWNGFVSPLNHHIRILPRFLGACSDLKKEVDYTDAFTGIRGGVLACHHIIPQNVIIRMYNIKTIDDARECPLLFDKHNMIVMLKRAHDKFHNLYGDDKNIYELTEAQIKELYLP